MKVKLLIVLSLIVSQFSFSQTEKLLKGVVSSENFLLYNVDVINKTSQKSTKTNENGEFVIAVQANDSLLFYSKGYKLKRLKVSSEQIKKNNLAVLMFEKPEELEEVIIRAMSTMSFRGSKEYEQGKLDEYATEKYDNREGYQAIRRGTFVNGLNFAEVGKRLLKLLKKDKETTNESLQEIEFAVVAKNTCDQKFFLETLKLKPDEIDLFLQFCEADPKSKELIKNYNVLSMMDFLTTKNNEFKNLKKL